MFHSSNTFFVFCCQNKNQLTTLKDVFQSYLCYVSHLHVEEEQNSPGLLILWAPPSLTLVKTVLPQAQTDSSWRETSLLFWANLTLAHHAVVAPFASRWWHLAMWSPKLCLQLASTPFLMIETSTWLLHLQMVRTRRFWETRNNVNQDIKSNYSLMMSTLILLFS